MTDFHDAAGGGLDRAGLEAVLRKVGAERYHNRHPFHHRMTAGDLSKGEMQAWALNRYCYQALPGASESRITTAMTAGAAASPAGCSSPPRWGSTRRW